MEKISNISSEETEEIENISENTIKKSFDWTTIYGELESGKYQIILNDSNADLVINISFSVDENGNVLYDEPELY